MLKLGVLVHSFLHHSNFLLLLLLCKSSLSNFVPIDIVQLMYYWYCTTIVLLYNKCIIGWSKKKIQIQILLPHFTPFPTLGSCRVNVFAQDVASQENTYVFPPFILVGPLRFLDKALFSFTIVVPKLSPLPYWRPLIQTRASHFVVLGRKADHDIVLFPSPHHIFSTRPLPWDLYAFRITNSLPSVLSLDSAT